MRRVKSIYSLLACLVFLACSKDTQQRNPFLPEIGFRFDINLNLPLYSPLLTQGNPIFLDNAAVGIRGVFIMNTGFELYRAFEASCPNHAPNTCSTLELDGQVARCSCEDYEYSLFTGQMLNRPDTEERLYDLLEYRANRSGNIVTIQN